MKSFKKFIKNKVSINHKNGRYVIDPSHIGIRNEKIEETYHPPTDMENMYTLEQHKLDERLKKHHNYDFSGSNSEHSHVLHNYTKDSKDINQHLHRQHIGFNMGGFAEMEAKKKVAALDKAFENVKESPEDYHTYSGIRFNPEDLIKHQKKSPGRVGAELKSEEDDHIKVHFPAYTSTSLSPHRAQSFSRKDEDGYHHIIKFRIPKGSKHAAHISGISNFNTEQESLLNRSRNAKIHKEPEITHSPAGKVKIWHAEIED